MFQLLCKGLIASFLGITVPDETLLSKVQQLTSPESFERAGEAYFSPDGGMIAFQATLKGEVGYQIFTMDLDTQEIRQISRGAQNCTCSYFRPDGQKIIFAASPVSIASPSPGGKYKWDLTPYMNIYESDIDGSNPVALTKGPAYHAECAYSPDGSSIVYASNEDGSMNIYTMKSDGSEVLQLTHTSDCYNGGPFFSPDGKKILFRADRDKPHYLQVYEMDIDGSNLRQHTDNAAVNWAPYWHPSQEFIAYTTSIHGHHNYEIYLVSLKTGKHYRVTYHPAFDGLSSFNREGTRMLWTSKRGEDNTSQIFIADFKLPDE